LGRACRTYGESTGAYRVLEGKLEERRLLERPGRRRENNIKMELKRRGMGGTDWIYLA
jgi:hypothetical protein